MTNFFNAPELLAFAGTQWLIHFLDQGLGYLLKVCCVSGLLFGYYRLFLRNRSFHSFNRYYLLVAAAGSLVLPLIPLPASFLFWTAERTPDIPTALHRITPGIWHEKAGGVTASPTTTVWFSWQIAIVGMYLLIAGFLCRALFLQLRYIRCLPAKYPREKLGDVDLFLTSEPGTPFSFFKSIFWNVQLDVDSPQGRQVLRHELHHIRQRHSIDLLVLQPLLILCWPNPFFHLLYREIGSVMIDALKQAYPIADELKESQQGIYVLRHSAMPSILILCGNINDPEDFAFITDERSREKIARQILEGVQRYESQAR